MNIPEKIELAMNEHKISRYKLAKDTGIAYTTITQILNGRTKNPQVAALQKIANYFGLPLDHFTKEDKEETNAPVWATNKDMRDFKKMLEEDEPIMFDGVPMSAEDKEKIKRIMEALFWEAKDMNKKTYGKKKKD